MDDWKTGEPLEEGIYLVTCQPDRNNPAHRRDVRMAARINSSAGGGFWLLLSSEETSDFQIIAWQKCPEPYKG